MAAADVIIKALGINFKTLNVLSNSYPTVGSLASQVDVSPLRKHYKPIELTCA